MVWKDTDLIKKKQLLELLEKHKDEDLIKIIEKNQKLLNHKNKYEETPLMYALKNKYNESIIKLLINQNADINHKNKYWRNTFNSCFKI